MPTRKRKSVAVAGTSQNSATQEHTNSPDTTSRKRVKHSVVTTSQKQRSVQEDDEDETDDAETQGEEMQCEGTVGTSTSKRSIKKAKAASKVSDPRLSLSLHAGPEADQTQTRTMTPVVVVNGPAPARQQENNYTPTPHENASSQTVVQIQRTSNLEGVQDVSPSPLRSIIGGPISWLFGQSNTSFSTPNGHLSTPSIAGHRVVAITPDPTSELEVKRFEEVTSSLNKDLGSVRAKLQILCTELQTLGFANTDAASEVVLANVRAAFREARAQMNQLLPGVDTSSCQNGEFLTLLTDNLRDLIVTITEHEETIDKAKSVEQVLTKKHDDLNDKLAATEHKNHGLHQKLQKSDTFAENRAREVLHLEDKLEVVQKVCTDLESAVDERDTIMADRDAELAIAKTTIEGLQADLRQTLEVCDRAKAMVTEIERDHAANLAQMKQDHAAEVQDLEYDLRQQVAARDTSDQEAEDQRIRASELELEVGDLAKDIAELKQGLTASEKATQVETEKRKKVRAELHAREETLRKVQEELQAAGTNLITLDDELHAVRTQAGAERHQREAAEEELDRLHVDAETLNARLREAGLQANELKSKLFEAQQLRETEAKTAASAAAAYKDRQEREMASEQKARAHAEELVAKLNSTTIPGLNAKLRDAEDAFAQLQTTQGAAIIEKQTIIDELVDEIADSELLHSELMAAKGQEIQHLHGEVDRHIEMLRTRDDALKALSSDVTNLQNEKASLEIRVEDEAMALLEAQTVYADCVAELRGAIKTRDMEMGKLIQERKDRETEHERSIALHAERIQDLEETVDDKETMIKTLTYSVENLTEKLLQSAQLGREAVTKLNAVQAVAHAASQEAERKFLQDVDVLVDELPLTSVSKKVVEQSHTVKPQRRSARVTGQTKVKVSNNHDSGFFEEHGETEM